MENQYSIEINHKIYGFHCDDGEEHVEMIKKKLSHVLSRLSNGDTDQVLSDYAMKIALYLADDAARLERECYDLEKVLLKRFTPLLENLDQVMKLEN